MQVANPGFAEIFENWLFLPKPFALRYTENDILNMYSLFLFSRTRHFVSIYLILLQVSINITNRMQNIPSMITVHNPQEISQVQFRIVLRAKVCQALL